MRDEDKQNLAKDMQSADDLITSGGDLSGEVAITAISRAPLAMVLTNPTIDDNPIVYVNRAFETVTGYSSDAAIGRNCRFLQGKDTSREALHALRSAVSAEEEVTVDILNYRADGSPFWNRLMIAPLTGEDGRLRYFLGVQLALRDRPAEVLARSEKAESALAEIQHRVKNHLSMIVGMIRLQARETDGAAGEFKTLSRRIEALQLLYEELSDSRRNDDVVALGAYLTRISNAIAHLDGRSGVRVNTDADAIGVPLETATQTGLILSEILTNSMQHAFEGRHEGLVDVRIKQLSGHVIRIQVSDDGIGLPEDVKWPDEGHLGGRIVAQLIEGLGARLSVERGATGTIFTLDVPAAATATE